jgi:hypothetical protein
MFRDWRTQYVKRKSERRKEGEVCGEDVVEAMLISCCMRCLFTISFLVGLALSFPRPTFVIGPTLSTISCV